MTDFIHETPSEEQPSKKPEPPATERESQKRVYTYIAVLFTAAFLLILWSFFSTHRSNQDVINELRSNTMLMQSAMEENDELEKEVDALESQLSALQSRLDETEDALEAAEDTVQTQENMLRAMDRLRRIESAYESYRNETAKELIRSFEADGLVQNLPSSSLYTDSDGNDAEAPLDAYRRISAKLFPDGVQ